MTVHYIRAAGEFLMQDYLPRPQAEVIIGGNILYIVKNVMFSMTGTIFLG